jgi:flagellin
VSNGGNKSLANLDITDSSKAATALDTIDATLRNLSHASTNMGSIENRLQFSTSNLMSVSESTESARSVIGDADFAVESALLAKGMVLKQSAAAMMAQSRAQPQLVLSLLKNS